MKKLVLTLLLAMPHVACGSEVQSLVVEEEEVQSLVEEDSDSHLESTVTIFKQSDGSSLLRGDSWGRIFPSTEHLEYSVGIDSKLVCLAALVKSIDFVDVQFTLFKKTGEQLVDSACHISASLYRDTELISDSRETRDRKTGFEADAKLIVEGVEEATRSHPDDLVVATRVSGRPEQVSRGESNRRKIRALLRGSIMRQVRSTEEVQNSLFTNVPESINVVSAKVSCNILNMPYRKQFGDSNDRINFYMMQPGLLR